MPARHKQAKSSADARKRPRSDGQDSLESDGTLDSDWVTNSYHPSIRHRTQEANQSDNTLGVAPELTDLHLQATGSVGTGIQPHHYPPGIKAFDHLDVPPPAAYLPTPDAVRFGHAHLLATKWMNSRQLKLMVEEEGDGCTPSFLNPSCLIPTVGLIYRKGKFTILEQKQIDEAIESFRSVCAHVFYFTIKLINICHRTA